MRVLFDQGTPVPLRKFLNKHSVSTALSRAMLLEPREVSDEHLPDGRFENSPPFQGWDCIV